MENIKKLFQDKHGRLDSSKFILHGYRVAVIIYTCIILKIVYIY